jgi:hypothetical protein
VYIIESFFEKNGGTFSGCVDLEIKRGSLISMNNIMIENIAAYALGAGSVYSLRGGISLCKSDKYIANFGIEKGVKKIPKIW